MPMLQQKKHVEQKAEPKAGCKEQELFRTGSGEETGERHAVSGHTLGQEGAETHKDRVLINVVKEDRVVQ